MLWTLISFHLALSFSQELQGVLAVQGPLTLSSSVGWFPFYPALLFRGRGAESWLARLYPLSSPTFLPVPFPCQASFFTLPFSLWAGFACRASCYVAPWVWTHLPNNRACEGSALCQIPSPSPYLLRCRVPAGVKDSFLVLCLHIFLSFILYMLQSYAILRTESRQTLQDKA